MPLTFFRYLLGIRKDKHIINKNVFILVNSYFGWIFILITIYLPLLQSMASETTKTGFSFDLTNRKNHSEFFTFQQNKTIINNQNCQSMRQNHLQRNILVVGWRFFVLFVLNLANNLGIFLGILCGKRLNSDYTNYEGSS